MKVHLWGTRGAVSVPAPATAAYGGNTACVQVEAAGDPPLILDGGFGLHWLGQALMQDSFARGEGRAHLLLSHTHWSHIQGIPFFPPILITGNEFTIYGCGSPERPLAALLAAQMDSAYCPVPNFLQKHIGARVDIREIGEGAFSIGQVRVTALLVNPVATAPRLGYRLESVSACLAYLPDIEYLEEDHRRRAVELCRNADLLIHDARYTAAEYPAHRGQGHASDKDAVDIARQSGAGRLVLFNHHPDRDDRSIDAMLSAHRNAPLPVEAGREGGEYTLGAQTP